MMASPSIWNGPYQGEPIASLQRPDGTEIPVYRLGDLPAALSEAIGGIPQPPASYGCQLVEELTPLTFSCCNEDGSSSTYQYVIRTYRLEVLDNAAGVEAYKAKVAAHNARAEVIKETLLSLIPALRGK